MTSNRDTRRRWIRPPYLVAFVATAIAFGFYVWSKWPRPSPPPEVIARRAMEAFEKGDYATLLRYVNDEEKEMLNLDEESFAELINRFYKPNTAGFESHGEITLPQASRTDALAMREYMHSDGRKYEMTLLVSTDADGPKVYGLVYLVVRAALHAKLPASVVDTGGPAYAQALLHAFEEELPVLTSLKVPGDTLSGDGRQVFRSWEKVHKQLKERVQRRSAL